MHCYKFQSQNSHLNLFNGFMFSLPTLSTLGVSDDLCKKKIARVIRFGSTLYLIITIVS